MKAQIISLILLVSNICVAQSTCQSWYSEIGGDIGCEPVVKPSPTNVLDCGVTIKVGSLKQYNQLNKLCSDAVAKYQVTFPESQLPKKINIPVSFLPSNVLTEHFGHLVEGSSTLVRLDGFTDITASGTPEHFYVLSNWSSIFYLKTVFAHELFHVLNALSHHEDSEDDAAAFTKGLGLGV